MPILTNISKFDISEWWKTQKTQYPILSLMSCDILTLLISLVALEIAFSLGNWILYDKHLLMSYKNLEITICLKIGMT